MSWRRGGEGNGDCEGDEDGDGDGYRRDISGEGDDGTAAGG